MNNNICCKNDNNEVLLLADFLRVASDENRLKIICLLRSREQCVCKIWQFLQQPQNLVSHHLKVLKNFGLLNSRKEGLNVYYSINDRELRKYRILLNKIVTKEKNGES